MKRRVMTEDTADSSNSVEISIDSKGSPKPTVKLYFDDPEEANAFAWKAMETINTVLNHWRTIRFEKTEGEVK